MCSCLQTVAQDVLLSAVGQARLKLKASWSQSKSVDKQLVKHLLLDSSTC